MARIRFRRGFALRRLAADGRGSIAPIAAVVGLMLVLVAGSGVDIGRAARVHTLLQDDADSAALAGAAQTDSATALASATAYISAATQNMTDKPTVSTVYAYDNTTNPAAPTMKVTISASLPTTLMSMVTASVPMTISATAQGSLVKNVTVQLTNFGTDAADADAIYGYGYDPTAYANSTTLYQFVPAAAKMTKLLCNKQVASCPTAPAIGSSISFQVAWADNVGFALSNTTGGYTNCYGQTSGQTVMYYSHRLDNSGNYHDYPVISVASGNAPSTWRWCGYSYTSNGMIYGSNDTQCSQGTMTYQVYQACLNSVNGETWNKSYNFNTATPPAYGYTYANGASRNPLIVSPAGQDCTVPGGLTMYWDDNGGGSDDNDHNDMVYTVACAKGVAGATVKLIS